MSTLGLGSQVSTPSSYCLYNYQLMHDNLDIRVQCFAVHYWSDLHPYGEVLVELTRPTNEYSHIVHIDDLASLLEEVCS